MAPRQTAQDKIREHIESAPYLFEADRLATFKGFNYDKIKGAECTSDKVARAGFYCTGKTSGKCAFCLKELEFDAEDDPWSEHASRQTECPFVRLGKLDESTWNVKDTLTLAMHSIKMAKYEQQMEMLNQWKNTLSIDALAEKLTKVAVKPRKPRAK